MRLRDIMSTAVVTIGPSEAASAAWTRMRRRNIRHLVVVDDAHLVGVLSERDLGGRTGAEGRKDCVVEDLMTAQPASAESETTVSEAADLMRERRIGSLPVLDGDRVVGIVTATDVFEALGRDATGPLRRAERKLLRPPTSSKRLGGHLVGRPRVRTPSKTTRERIRTPNVDKREPLADRVPRPVKRTAGRTAAPLTPANVRVDGVRLDEQDRAYIRRRLGEKLGKYASSIERVTVRVRDVNGPRGGVDLLCRIKVVLSGLPSAVVEHQDAVLQSALTAALSGVERAVRRAVQRRRMRPIRSVAGGEPGPGS